MPYRTLKNVAHDCLGIIMTDDQALRAALSDKELAFYSDGRTNVTGGVMDTADRELLVQFIVDDILGPGHHWPVNGEGPQALEIFKRDIVKVAPGKGYVLLAGIWPKLTPASPEPEHDYKIEGTFIYSLQDTGRYRKGEVIQENRIYFQVNGSENTKSEEKIALAEEIHTFLNARLELRRVGLLDADGKLDVDTLSRIVDNGIESII